MTVRADGNVIRLEGDCGVEEAEVLVGLLQGAAVTHVDLGQCRHLHSAVVQALVAFRVALAGDSPAPFIQGLVVPALEAARASAAERQPGIEAVEHQSISAAEAPPSERS